MTAFLWLAEKWSQWILVCFGALVGVVVLAEGVEQAPFLSQSGSVWALAVGIAAKLPLLVRDLWTPLMALTSALFVCRYRGNALKNFSLSGCRPAAFFAQMSLLALIASVLVLGATEITLSHQKPHSGQSAWVLIDGLATHLASQSSGAVEVLQIQSTNTGMVVNRAVDLDPALAQVLLRGANPAQASLSQLIDHPHPLARSWLLWRLVSWVLPGLLAFGIAWFCWVLPWPVGLLSALSLGVGAGFQVCGSAMAQMGLHSACFAVLVGILSVAAWVPMWRWNSKQGGLGP